MFSAVQTVVILVETTVGVTQTLFSEAEPIFYASETGFSMTEKNVGAAPVVFVQLCGAPCRAHQTQGEAITSFPLA